MDTAQWPEQGIGVVKVVPMEGNNNSPGAVAVNNNTKAISAAAAPRPQKPQALNCPRCNSAHTKFCYYNNYSLTQPRYFCKTCRRYWTEGGSLRNVPVGGGSRKNKRSSSSSNPTIAASSSSLSKNIKLPHEIITSNSQNPNSKIIYHDQGQDLNLAYPPTGPSTYNSTATGISEFVEFPSATSSHHHHQFSQLLKSGIGGRGSFTSFMSMIPVSDSSNNNSAAIYSSSSGGAGLPFQEFSKPITSGVNFSLDQQHGFESSGGGGVYGSLQLGVHQESSGSNNHAKLFNFPFEDLKQQPVLNSSTTSTQDPELMDQQSRGTTVTTTNTTQGDHHHHHHHHHHRHQSPAGYWNNINGGGSW